MKKYLKKLLGLGLGIMLAVGMSLPTYAESIPTEIGQIIDGSEIIEDDYSEVTFYNVARGNILNRGIARITDNGNGTVNVYGAVLAAVTCDKLQLKLILQKLEGGIWKDVTSKTYSVSNNALLSKSFNVSAVRGGTYRTKAACIATEGGTSESQTPVTDGIIVK